MVLFSKSNFDEMSVSLYKSVLCCQYQKMSNNAFTEPAVRKCGKIPAIPVLHS